MPCSSLQCDVHSVWQNHVDVFESTSPSMKMLTISSLENAEALTLLIELLWGQL